VDWGLEHTFNEEEAPLRPMVRAYVASLVPEMADAGGQWKEEG